MKLIGNVKVDVQADQLLVQPDRRPGTGLIVRDNLAVMRNRFEKMFNLRILSIPICTPVGAAYREASKGKNC
jgi:hypothetical protein